MGLHVNNVQYICFRPAAKCYCSHQSALASLPRSLRLIRQSSINSHDSKRVAATNTAEMVFTSPYGSLVIREDKCAWSYVEQHAHSDKADSPALICGLTARQVTFAEMHGMAKQIVAGLYASGIRKDDVRGV